MFFVEPTTLKSNPISFVLGDFNSHTVNWGYAEANADCEAVEKYTENDNHLKLSHDSKLSAVFNGGE